MLLLLLRLASIRKCIAIIFLLRMQTLSTLIPSGEESLNEEAPRLLFPEYLMAPRCPQKTWNFLSLQNVLLIHSIAIAKNFALHAHLSCSSSDQKRQDFSIVSSRFTLLSSKVSLHYDL